MNIIKEYLLDKKCYSRQTVYLPKNAEVVAVRETDKGLMIFAVANPVEATLEQRIFKICNLDENLYEDKLKYVGNFMSIVGLRHVVEIIT